MVSPVNVSYSVASGQTIYAGLSIAPAWRSAMTAGTWAEIGNTLAEIDPANDPLINPNHPGNAPWRGNIGINGLVNPWCGACYDSDNDVLWLPLQGGHADYAGNEPYKIDLSQDSPAWMMVRNPSGAVGNTGTLNDGQESTGLYFDGRPRAIHSTNKTVYIPGVGPALGVQGNTYINGTGPNKAILIDPTTGEMTRHGALNTGATSNSTGGGACYDPSRHAIWFRGAGTGILTKYDIATDSWANVGSSKAVSGGGGNYSALEYLPDYDCILWLHGGLANDFAVFDCATNTLHEPGISGSLVGITALNGTAQPRRFLSNSVAIWDNAINTAVINTLSFNSNPRTDTWQIGQLPVDGSNAVTPTARTVNGTFGRFFYSSKLDGFGLFNSVNDKIFFFARS